MGIATRILARLATAGAIWAVPVAKLARELGTDPAGLDGALADLVATGDVELWPDHPQGPAACLSAWARATLGVAPPDDADQVHRFERLRDLQFGLVSLDEMEAAAGTPIDFPDPKALEPAAAIGAQEFIEGVYLGLREKPGLKSEATDALPAPRWLLGSTTPGFRPAAKGSPCPICEDRRLRKNTLCLCCGRWSLDPWIPRTFQVAVERSLLRDVPDGRRLAGGVGPARAR